MGGRASNLTPERAARLYGAGLKQAAIAARYGVSQMTVSRTLAAAGVSCHARPWREPPAPPGRPRQPLPGALADRLRALVAGGYSVRAIARKIQAPPTTTWKWLRKLEETP